jgi:hypothetical protein
MMMNKILVYIINFFLIIVLLSTTAIAHKSETHAEGSHFDPASCIQPEDRTPGQLKWDIWVNKEFHRLSKRQQECAIYNIQRLELGIKEAGETIEEITDENEQLQQSLENAALCADISFNHRSKKGTKLFAKPDLKSNKVADVKSGADLLYVSDSSSQKKWSFVLLKNGKKCNPGYIQKQFISKKDELIKKAPIEVKADLISITKPSWSKKEKLIVVSASGFITIKGFVDSDKIDQIIVNEKERQINNDDTFSFNIRVKDVGTEVRIVGNKKGVTKKTITFQIKVK